MASRGQQYGWGIGSLTAFLVVLILMIFLPLAMGPGSLGPPSWPVLLLIPVILIGLLFSLCLSS
ncbi:uncharacterized protein LOC127809979 [Diospyros lotus]|uniref:uncharacterized protein LOC127809979 n=1 Tax=Diospyros lotus TaxID=55363 RepID=UPI00225B9463|nr:uncharacterized protein LOC127809979 [Diospyros lotus]